MSKEVSFACSMCDKTFTRNYAAKEHENNVHHKKTQKIKCPFWPNCENVHKANGLYGNKGNLRVHLKKHHMNEDIAKYLEIEPKSKRSKRSKQSKPPKGLNQSNSKQLSQSEEMTDISNLGIPTEYMRKCFVRLNRIDIDLPKQLQLPQTQTSQQVAKPSESTDSLNSLDSGMCINTLKNWYFN